MDSYKIIFYKEKNNKIKIQIKHQLIYIINIIPIYYCPPYIWQIKHHKMMIKEDFKIIKQKKEKYINPKQHNIK